jgi:hypothetical protein
MNILNPLSSYPIFLVKEMLLPVLTMQQKKIMSVATLALSFLVAYYVINRF